VIWVRGVLQQAYGMVATDAAQAAALKTGARADFEKVLNSEKDSQKRETLVKERELLDGILILLFFPPPLKSPPFFGLSSSFLSRDGIVFTRSKSEGVEGN